MKRKRKDRPLAQGIGVESGQRYGALSLAQGEMAEASGAPLPSSRPGVSSCRVQQGSGALGSCRGACMRLPSSMSVMLFCVV